MEELFELDNAACKWASFANRFMVIAYRHRACPGAKAFEKEAEFPARKVSSSNVPPPGQGRRREFMTKTLLTPLHVPSVPRSDMENDETQWRRRQRSLRTKTGSREPSRGERSRVDQVENQVTEELHALMSDRYGT